MRDETSNAILVADGGAGLARMTFELRDFRTGARLTAEISPIAAVIDHQGQVKVTISGRGGNVGPLEADGLVLVGGPGGHHLR